MNKYNLNANEMQEIRKSINYLNHFVLPTAGTTQLGGGSSLKFKSFENGKPYMTFTNGNKDFNIQLQDLFNSSMQGGSLNNDDDTLDFSLLNSMRGGGNMSESISISSFNMQGGSLNANMSESLDLSIFNKAGGANIKNFDATSSMQSQQGGADFSATSPMQQGGANQNDFSATSDAMNSVMKGGSRKRLEFSATSPMQQGGTIQNDFSATSDAMNTAMKGGSRKRLEFSATSDAIPQMGGAIFKKMENKNNVHELSTLHELSEIKNSRTMKGGAKYNNWKQNMQQLGVNSSSTDFCD